MRAQPITWIFENHGHANYTPEQKQRLKDHLRRRVRKELSNALSASGSVTIQRGPYPMETVIICDSLGNEITRLFRWFGYTNFHRVKKPA